MAPLVLALQVGLAPPSSAATTSTFAPGSGSATAEGFSFQPALGGESVGAEFGVSSTDFADSEGQAQSETLNPGTLLGLVDSGTLPGLGGVQAESTDQATQKSATFNGSASGPAGTGVEQASAAASLGTATTTLLNIDLPGVLSIAGATSTATSLISNGQTRDAEATVHIASLSLLGGLVELGGLQWDALQRTGANPAAAGTFTIASVKVAGTTLPLSADSVTKLLATINNALAVTGFHLSLPTQVLGSNGSVQETPLAIGIDNSALGQEVFGPVIKTVQPLRSDLVNALIEADPGSGGTANLVLELALGILAGQGSVDLDLGGAYATTSADDFVNPLSGSSGSGLSAPDALSGALGNPSTLPFVMPLGIEGETTPTIGTPSSTVGAASKPVRVSIQRLGSSQVCQSTTVGGCRHGESTVTLAILAAVTLALVLAEFVRLRRRWRISLRRNQ